MHWVRKQWPSRHTMKPLEKNIKTLWFIGKTLCVLSPLRIKLGLMKQFVKALGRYGDCFGCVSSTFPGLSYEKKKARVI